ncbi:MAG TPA: hypothetical protein PKV67_11835 [Hyphomonas sp.]|nr:hypothetical protein [Hyphomonas sp.]HRJ01458.1 hypothetical protein [Hyphomonas sp.]
MAWFKSARAAALSVLLAAGCTTSSVQETAPAIVLTPAQIADQLVANALTRPAATSAAFDIEGANSLLGGIARITYETAGADAESGAYRLTGVQVEILGEKPSTLFTAEEALFWNADIAGLAARLNGENLDQTLALFDRIELGGVKADLSGYLNAVDDVLTAALDEAAAPDTVYESSSMEVGRVVLEGMTLHPWTFEEREGENEGVAAIRLVSAIARGFSLDTFLYIDTRTNEVMHSADFSTTVSSVYDSSLFQGYDRGDIAAMVTKGMTLSGAIPLPAIGEGLTETDAIAEPATLIEFAGTTDFAAWNGLRLSKLLEWGERGELPPITEKDLWSFGTYIIDGMAIDFAGKPMFNIGHLEMSADQFAWFLPERITFRHEDASLLLADFVTAMDGLGLEQDPLANEPSIAEIAAILERTGFATISGDGAFSLTWDSDTGETLLVSDSITDNLYSDDTRIALTLPSYSALVPGFGIDGRSPDTDLLGHIFETGFAFNGGHYSLTDSGLLNAISALVIEFAKLSGEAGGEEGGDDMLAGFADSTPDAVRSFASMMLLFTGSAVTQEIPGAEGWVESLAAFIAEGGTFRIAMAPPAPVTAASLTPPEGAGMQEVPPMDLVGLFGMTVEHVPPEKAN